MVFQVKSLDQPRIVKVFKSEEFAVSMSYF